MKIFVSYSFRPENSWVEDYVIPLLECFGHAPFTGRILDAGPLDEDVRRKIKQCRRVLCFVTRAAEIHGPNGAIEGYRPPEWVRDELMMARGAGQDAIEFRETDVRYEGAAPFRGYVNFDRDNVPRLLLDLARRLKDWPVGPLQLRLAVPAEFKAEIEQAANAGILKAQCAAISEGEPEYSEELPVRVLDDRLIVPFWIKPNPNLSIDIVITLGARRLACRGISPAVREARLAVV